MSYPVTEINLDEVEASIKRCEEFLAANEVDFSMKPAARTAQQQTVPRKIYQETTGQQTQRSTQVSTFQTTQPSNLKPSDEEIQRVIRDSRQLAQQIVKQPAKPVRNNVEGALALQQRYIEGSTVYFAANNVQQSASPRQVDTKAQPMLRRAEPVAAFQTSSAVQRRSAPPGNVQKSQVYSAGPQKVRAAGDRIAEHTKKQENASSARASRLSDSYKTVSTSQFAINTPQPAPTEDKIKDFRLTAFEQGPLISTQRDQMIYQRKQSKPVKNYKTYQKIEQIRKDLEEKEMKECTFYPHVNTNGYRATVDETAERLYYQSQMLQQQRDMQYYERYRGLNYKCSFQPQINGRSRELAAKQTISVPVEDRMLAANEQTRMRMNLRYQQKEYTESRQNQPFLTEEYKKKRDLLAERQRVRRESQKQTYQQMAYYDEIECTYQPRINPKSELLAAEYPRDFEERSKVWYERRQQKLEQIRLEEEKKVTGVPNLVTGPAVQQTGLQYAHERLYFDAQIRYNLKSSMERSNDLVYADENCRFSPVINAQSRELAKSKNYNIYQDSTAIHRQKLEKFDKLLDMKEKQEAQQTFQPKVTEFAKQVQPHYDFKNPDVLMAYILDEQETKEVVMQTKQTEQLLRTQDVFMQEKPTITALDKRIYQPREVKGLDMFMEKVQRYRQLDEEKRSREEKAFGYGYNWQNRQTVAEEFDLSQPDRKKTDFVEVKAVEKTTDQKMRDLVGAILRSEI